MDVQKKMLYRSGNGFYCENCGYLRGSPFNDGCLVNCEAEWYFIQNDKDKEYIQAREKEIQKLKLQEAEAEAERKIQGGERQIQGGEEEEETEEHEPQLGTPAPLCMQLSISHINAETYEHECYNDNLTALLNSRILSSLKLREERMLKNK